MAVYIPKFNGFIADSANIDFKRCDGMVYHCETATATGLTASANSISITGGQSQYPIGFIDTDRGLECSFTNAQFDADMFEIANGGTAVDADSSTTETKKYAVGAENKITLPFVVDTTSVYVRGLELTNGTVEAGKFKAEASDGNTVLTFAAADAPVGTEFYVSYNRRLASAHEITVNTNTPTARGEVWMHWPLYSNGTDCTEAAIKGWVHVHVFRARVTAQPSIDSSYKTAATHQMTFTAMDPQRADGRMYRITYEPLTANGAINTNYSQDTNFKYL